jgi:hypothetical protein
VRLQSLLFLCVSNYFLAVDKINLICYNVVGDRDVHPKAVTSLFPLFLNL